MSGYAESDAEGTLWIEVNEKHAAAVFSQRRTEAHRGGRLADPTLLVDHRHHLRRSVLLQHSGHGESWHGATRGSYPLGR